MGWQARDWYLGEHRTRLFDTNGNAGPTIWLDGRVVGGWIQRRDGEIAYRLLEDVGGEAADLVAARAADLRVWLGDLRFIPRFRTPRAGAGRLTCGSLPARAAREWLCASLAAAVTLGAS
jgi:hypothetical protein